MKGILHLDAVNGHSIVQNMGKLFLFVFSRFPACIHDFSRPEKNECIVRMVSTIPEFVKLFLPGAYYSGPFWAGNIIAAVCCYHVYPPLQWEIPAPMNGLTIV
ncbi:hypothetical protein [Methanoregula sp.]|uniref:hypothetical protein n=1 Tax=Methanoregula sp. TaxID=2052170 RepID=UPI002371E67C|nr:hypothetical protein [Methanoregula sp.]MDD1686076.1 hypothetical protein [Methanoregula sp.]